MELLKQILQEKKVSKQSRKLRKFWRLVGNRKNPC